MSERVLSDWIDAFMDYSNNSEPPASFRLWTAISVLSATLQRKCKLPWGTLTFYPNMYVVLVAPSGKARKGTAMGFADELLEGLGVKLAAESTTRESLIQALAEANDNTIDLDGSVNMHSSLTVFAPELTVFLGYNNHALMSDLTDWYDCRSRWTYRTKNMGTDEITGVYVTLFGATTPELIRTTMPLDAIGGGLTSRMIFVFERKKGKIVPAPFQTDAELELFKKLQADLERIHTLRGEFKVTRSYLDHWTDWYTAQEDNPPFNDHRFAGYIERRPNHVKKLAMICNASRTDKMIIDRTDLERAIEILKFTEVKMVDTFSGVGKSNNADVLTRVMNEIGTRGSMLKQDLVKMFYFDADARTMDSVIETLKSMNFLQIRQEGRDTYIEHKGESGATLGDPDPQGVARIDSGNPRK
jgi:hypothetical protein